MDKKTLYKNGENKKVDTAITLLNAFSKKVVESDENYIIFLPQFKVEDIKIEVEIPVFNKNDGQLICWLIYDFNTYVFEHNENHKDFQIDMQHYAELDYKDKKYQQNLEVFVDILAYAKKLLKTDNNSEEFRKIFDELHSKIEKYNELLANTVIEELYNIYFEIEDANIEIENLQDENNLEDEETTLEIEEQNEIEIKQIDVEENDESQLEVIEQNAEEMSISDKLIELSKDGIKKQDIDFEWQQKDGLRYVSDESLELAYELLKNMEISLKLKNEKVIITNNIINLCDNKYTTKELLEKFQNNEKFTTKITDYSVKQDVSINRICDECKFQRCPKQLVGYIYYLINKDLLLEKLEDRKKFREENQVYDQYAFEWKYGNILRMIPDNIYEFSYELVKRDYIYVRHYLINGKIEISNKFTCEDYKIMGANIDKIKESNQNRVLKRSPDKNIELCDTYNCALKGCPQAIAGIIKYLIDIGKEDILESERQYYHEHQEEMNKELDEMINSRLNKISENKEKIIERFEEYRDTISNFNDLIFVLNNTQGTLHCTIEGEDSVGKDKFIASIIDYLYENDRLNEKNYSKISLQNLAASNAYFYYGAPNEKNKDINGVNYIEKGTAKYTVLKEKEVYVVNKISEFLNDYNIYKDLKNFEYSELRNKQFNYVLKLLTDMSSKYFIILDGTKEEIDELFGLEPKLQFIYSKYRFNFPEISLDEIFELYKKDLAGNLVAELLKDEAKYKAECLEYISMNKNFIPFTNVELASYLAMYSNSNNEIVFPENIYKKESVDEALESIVGLDSVKKKVKEFEKYMMFKVKAEALGLKLYQSNMHMVFTGNPGVGKTTIARIMAKMLFDLGVIKENKLVEVERKDLIAEYIGQTAPKTAEVIKNAMGGVLFIDEAYSLTPTSERDFGGEAIATLIKAMEDHKDEFVVIFAGYKDEMKGFIDSNPGIASRIGYTFDFPDYNVEELYQIFDKKIRKMGFEYLKECELEIKKVCTYFSARKAFGNGRFVDKLIQEILMKHAINNDDDIIKITVNDIPTIKEFNNTTEPEESTDELLENVVGLENLKLKIKEFEQYVKFIKEAEKNNVKIPNQNMHMIFTGNPGTGKTTIARIMAKILYNAGILQENKLVEVERKDLIGRYIGETAPKTTEVIEKAIGGVLFIDEAYSLGLNNASHDFGGEAIATLIKAMEDKKGEFVVIFAGYKKEMGEFINLNSGIASRIGYTFDFEDYSREELCEILYKKIAKSNLKILDNAKENVFELMNYFHKVENIGNGRFADRVFQEILLKHSKNKKAKIDEIGKNDIPSIEEMSACLFNGERMIKPDIISEEALRETAIHEIGHAFVRYKLFDNPGIIQITIKPEGTGTLGYVQYKVDKDGYVRKKSTIIKRIKVSLAGMAAEEVFTGEFASGNTSDLRNATWNAKEMVTRFGMSELGLGQINENNEAMGMKVQETINSILKECYEETVELIKENKKSMTKVVDYLYEHKEIDEEQFVRILKSSKN